MQRQMLRSHAYFRNLLRIICAGDVTDGRTEVDLTVRPDVDPNRTRITRFVEVPANWGPGTKAGRKEGKSWRGNKKRKREDGDEGTEMSADGN